MCKNTNLQVNRSTAFIIASCTVLAVLACAMGAERVSRPDPNVKTVEAILRRYNATTRSWEAAHAEEVFQTMEGFDIRTSQRSYTREHAKLITDGKRTAIRSFAWQNLSRPTDREVRPTCSVISPGVTIATASTRELLTR